MYIFMVCIILATLVGNLTVIISISHFNHLHTPTNFLLLSMATVDFLLGFLIMTCSMVRSVEHCWYFGELFCKIHMSMDIMLSTASIFHLSFISIDCYYAVCDPLRHKLKINTFIILVMILVNWMIPAGFAFGMIFLDLNLRGAEEIYNHARCAGECFVFFSETSGVESSIVSFYIPGFVMLYIHRKIYSTAKRQARSIDTISQKKMHFETKNDISFGRERKAAKTLGIIMEVFLICWSPFFFFTATNPFMNYVIPPILIDALVWFGYLNSTFNPIFYAFFYTWFCRALKMILFGKVFQQDSSRTNLFLE
ncbi:trace amine-associated receptor 1 [Columba livia]|uniref:Trace amine-associated receptor 1 n=2 Tax=Columba livia TaxID=8932 RepID=A0A2I0MVN9_COLLI|nr:trace amine-associated receptor 1 [Columba livia]